MEKEEKRLEYRMYFLVPYNISGRQSGIQSLHGVVEYHLMYGEDVDYLDWAQNWKTVMLLNGGTSNNAGSHHYMNPANNPDNEPFYGTMELHAEALEVAGVKYATFLEPDLNNMLSNIVFLCDERVFKTRKKKPDDVIYPHFEDWVLEKYSNVISDYAGNSLAPMTVNDVVKIIKKGENPEHKAIYDEWVEFIGGPKNVFLRSFVSQFRLAEN